MPIRWVAFIAAILSSAVAEAQQPRVLTLDAAFARTLERHPDLTRFMHLREGANAAVELADQRPAPRLELELENIARTSRASALEGAESTLSLASVLEPRTKREARIAVAEAQRDSLATQEEQRRADLLAEVARRYLDLLALQSLQSFSVDDVTQRDAAVQAATARVRAGATPDSVRLAAEAAATRALVQRDRLRGKIQTAALRLAAMWRSRTAEFDRVGGNLLSVPGTPSLASLRDLIDRSPELRHFALESRVREARVQLARTDRATSVDWRVGARRLDEDGSWAGVIGVSIPLGNERRSRPGIRAAQAELAAMSMERESAAIALESTLLEAHAQLTAAREDIAAAGDLLIPKLEQSRDASERAFRAGAITYAEWSQAEADLMSARREQLMAGLDAHRALIEIQRLTGMPFAEASEPETQR